MRLGKVNIEAAGVFGSIARIVVGRVAGEPSLDCVVIEIAAVAVKTHAPLPWRLISSRDFGDSRPPC